MYNPPRILDASALVDLAAGHPLLMQLLDLADTGQVHLAVPTLAIAEAQAVLAVAPSAWDHILGHRGVTDLPVSVHVGVDIGDLARPRLLHHPVHEVLIGPLMVAQVLREALAMNAIIVTRFPEAYGGHDVAVNVIDG